MSKERENDIQILQQLRDLGLLSEEAYERQTEDLEKSIEKKTIKQTEKMFDLLDQLKKNKINAEFVINVLKTEISIEMRPFLM